MKLNEIKKMIREELSELNLDKGAVSEPQANTDKQPGMIALKKTAQTLVQKTPQGLSNQEAEMINTMILNMLELASKTEATPIFKRVLEFMSKTSPK